jgi:hypothetical protein
MQLQPKDQRSLYRLHVGHCVEDLSFDEWKKWISEMSELAYADYRKRLLDAASFMP